MELAADAGRSALGPADGLESETWAEKEFGGAPLGDARLSKRLVNVARAKGETPGRAFCGVAQGDGAAAKGYYRLIDMPEDSEVTMANILRPHRDRWRKNLKAHYHTAHSGPANRAVRAGRQRSELQRFGRVHRTWSDRYQPNGC